MFGFYICIFSYFYVVKCFSSHLGTLSPCGLTSASRWLQSAASPPGFTKPPWWTQRNPESLREPSEAPVCLVEAFILFFDMKTKDFCFVLCEFFFSKMCFINSFLKWDKCFSVSTAAKSCTVTTADLMMVFYSSLSPGTSVLLPIKPSHGHKLDWFYSANMYC